MEKCELLNRTKEEAAKRGLPKNEVICAFTPVCEGTVCWQFPDAVVNAQKNLATLPTPIERFQKRMEVTITGRRSPFLPSEPR